MRTGSKHITPGVFFQKLIIALLALLVLNSSVDVREPLLNYVWDGTTYAEDASHNDIESLYELITEIGFGWEDHLPEPEDSSDEETSYSGVDFCKIINELFRCTHPFSSILLHQSFYIPARSIFEPGIVSPPPDHA